MMTRGNVLASGGLCPPWPSRTRLQAFLHLKDACKIWDVLKIVCRDRRSRHQEADREFPEMQALIKKYPNVLKLHDDLKANAGLTPLVHSAWQLMGGGS